MADKLLIAAVVEHAFNVEGTHWEAHIFGLQKLPDEVVKAMAHGKVWITVEARDPAAIIDNTGREALDG